MKQIKIQIDQAVITLCFALFAYNDGLISEEVMNLYRDTYAEDVLSLTLRRRVECDRCKGTGLGEEMEVMELHGMPHIMNPPDCPKCKGTGELPVEEKSIGEIIKDGGWE